MSVEVFEFSTLDRELAHETVAKLYEFERPIEFTSRSTEFEFSLRSTTVDGVGCDSLHYGLQARLATPPFPVFAAATVLGGGASYSLAGEEISVRRGDSVRFPTDGAPSSVVDDVRLLSVRFPLDVLDRIANSHAGVPAGGLRFQGMAPATPALARVWWRLASFVRNELESSAGPGGELVVHQLTELIAATALTVFPNTVMDGHHARGAGWVAPASLRRVVAYIDGHAAEPITLADMAAAAGTTGRAVQAAFRRHYDTTPLAYLRRVRLEGAHRDLQAADPARGDTVGGIAARWGFSHAGRFTNFYRTEFGVSPSHTLRS